MYGEIANADLTEHDLPSPAAEWHQIAKFALTFNGYDHWGSFGKCAETGSLLHPVDTISNSASTSGSQPTGWRANGSAQRRTWCSLSVPMPGD